MFYRNSSRPRPASMHAGREDTSKVLKPVQVGDDTLRVDAVVRVLIAMGLCDELDLVHGRRVAAEGSQRLDIALVKTGRVTEAELAAAYSTSLRLPIAGRHEYPKDAVLKSVLKPYFLTSNRICPLRIDQGTLILAMVDALDNFLPATIAAATCLRVSIRVAVPIELDAALSELYRDDAEMSDQAARPLDTSMLQEEIERLKDLASEAPIIRLLNSIMAHAVETNASDIHFEPHERTINVRCRYDGLLAKVSSHPIDMAPALISRIKVLAKLDIAERRLPQDGRLQFVVRGNDVDFRVSVIPSMFGETVVMRVLDTSARNFSYTTLGLSDAFIKAWSAVLQRSSGMVIVTGPTGSGKTTTLYSTLSSLNDESRRVVSIEDPVEYQMPGICQMHVKPQIGLTFSSLFRSALRQDPDVIMIGEIRDVETAGVAAQAALTGHLVLSTLHTNSAASAIVRLLDMGLEDYLITAVLRAVVAQRLVRRLCVDCKRLVPGSERNAVPLKHQTCLDSLSLDKFEAVGCASCRSTGFSGRFAIMELLTVDATIEGLIRERADERSITAAAIQGGMIRLSEAGMNAVLQGDTTTAELRRHIDL